MSKNKNSKHLLFIGIPLFISFLLLLFLIPSFNSYCSKNSEKCFNIGFISVPNDTPTQYLASFIGAFLTFTTIYLLEVIKEGSEPKSELEVSFNIDDKEELIVRSNPHLIFVPRKQENVELGEATYLRVKVTNKGNKIASGCSGYLKTIRRKEKDGSFTKLEKYDSPMRLLWPYERKEDYRSTSVEQIPSGASEYLDILVSYDNSLKCGNLTKEKESWFLKLKTQPQPGKHVDLLRIDRNSDIEYELTIEVYADGCTFSSVLLILEHKKNTTTVFVYDFAKGPDNSMYFNLCDSSTPSKNLKGYKPEELYNLL
jgi:hypothetical protein